LTRKLKIDEKLFCKITKLYGRTFNLPPLAVKIYAYLKFDFKNEGLSFDEIVETFAVSKSSASTSINLLLSNNLITESNKLNERKRYFTINNDFVKQHFEFIRDKLSDELEIMDGLEAFNTEEKNPEDDRKTKMHTRLLRHHIKTIQEYLNQL